VVYKKVLTTPILVLYSPISNRCTNDIIHLLINSKFLEPIEEEPSTKKTKSISVSAHSVRNTGFDFRAINSDLFTGILLPFYKNKKHIAKR